MASLVVSALSTWSNKGLKKAEKDVSTFDKSVKKLAKTFAGAFGTAAIINFGKASVKAFMADEKAAKALETQLNNLGYSYSAPGVELYIANLQKMYGVMDDQLRPAFQTLITASGSLTQSQKALDVALNVSAATGRSVEEVSAALAKGFTGQTTALSRLGAGLDKATLASGDMNKIMDALSTKFSGQATARLSTYAGQMDRLSVAAANAQEIIGKGLLDSLALFSKDNSIENAASDMENFAQAIADATFGMAKLLSKVEVLTGLDKVKTTDLLAAVNLPAYLLAKYGAKERAKPTSNFTYSLGPNADMEIARAQELKLLKERNKAAASLLAKEKAKLALDDLAKKFDTERIGLMAALNAATDEETKLRIKAQLALLDNNEALAKKYNAELEAAAKAKLLAEAMGNLATGASAAAQVLRTLSNTPNLPAGAIATGVSGILGGSTPGASAVTGSQLANAMAEAYLASPSALEGLGGVAGALSSARYTGMALDYARSTGSAKPEVTVNLNAAGSIIGLQEVDAAIQDALLRIYRQNGDLAPAGFIP
jgi:hypothetical protein